jgi:hypothetical protein
MTQKNLIKADLAQFTGSERWFRHAIVRHVLYTEGVDHVGEHGEAYWLIDAIAFAQSRPEVAAEPFQVWHLTVAADHSATLACDDGNGRIVYTQAIPHTDFPLDDIKLYFADGVILLPSEY